MKRIFCFLLFAAAALPLSAQTLQASFEKSLPDSVKYVFPAFAQGSILYKDGGFSSGMLNISTLDQTLRFIDTDGSEKAIIDDTQVDRVSIGGVLFVHPQQSYLGIVDSVDEVMLCVEKKLKFDDAKTGAYGASSSTTNIKSMQSASAASGIQYALSGDVNYEIRETPFLYRKGRLFVPSAKRMKKLFPDKTAVLDAYLEANPVDFSDYESVAALFRALK